MVVKKTKAHIHNSDKTQHSTLRNVKKIKLVFDATFKKALFVRYICHKTSNRLCVCVCVSEHRHKSLPEKCLCVCVGMCFCLVFPPRIEQKLPMLFFKEKRVRRIISRVFWRRGRGRKKETSLRTCN